MKNKALNFYREEVSFVLHDIARKNAINLKNEVHVSQNDPQNWYGAANEAIYLLLFYMQDDSWQCSTFIYRIPLRHPRWSSEGPASELTSFLAFVLIEKHNRTFVNVESSGSPSTNVVTGLADRYKSVKVPATTNAPMMDSMVLKITFSI